MRTMKRALLRMGIEPWGTGFKADGLFFSTWTAAWTHVNDGKIPSAEQVEQFEQDCAELDMLAREHRYERVNSEP